MLLPANDPISVRLRQSAPAAALKLDHICASEGNASAAYAVAATRLAEAKDGWRLAESRAREIAGLPVGHPFLVRPVGRSYVPPGPERRVQSEQDRKAALEPTRAAAEAARVEVERLETAVATAKSNVIGLSTRLIAWLRETPGTLAPFEGKVAMPKNGGADLHGTVNKLRADLAGIDAQVQATRTAPFPSRLGAERIRRFVANLAQRGEPDLLRVIELDRDPGFAAMSLTQHGSPVPVSAPDAIALLAWLNPQELTERLLGALGEVADGDRDALDHDERAAREKQLLAQRLTLERVEESLIEGAERDGLFLARRIGADPRAVLGLADTVPGPQLL